MIYQGDSAQRTAYIRALRNLADWLEANPGIPVPSTRTDIQLSTHGTDEQCRQDLQDVAAAFGTEPFDPYDKGMHLQVAKQFGSIRYYVHFGAEAWTREFNEQQRLGKEAMAAKKAAVPVHVTGPVAELIVGGAS